MHKRDNPLLGQGELLVAKALEMALAGNDVTALRMCLARLRFHLFLVQDLAHPCPVPDGRGRHVPAPVRARGRLGEHDRAFGGKRFAEHDSADARLTWARAAARASSRTWTGVRGWWSTALAIAGLAEGVPDLADQ